jgi:hypothetical protein
MHGVAPSEFCRRCVKDVGLFICRVNAARHTSRYLDPPFVNHHLPSLAPMLEAPLTLVQPVKAHLLPTAFDSSAGGV